MKYISKAEVHFGARKAELFRIATPENGLIAVTHLLSKTGNAHNTPLIFLPGMFSNRRFWLSDKGIGFAAYLSDHGYDCWIIDRRGLGASGKSHYKNINLLQCIEHDLGAAQSFIASHNPSPAYWLGHSFGGVINALSLAQGHLKSDQVAGLVNFSSQLTVGKKLLNKPYSAVLYTITATMGKFPAKALNLGPEDEAPEVMRDCCRLVAWAKKDSSSSADDSFWKGFDQISQPILALGSEGDTVDPAKGCEEFIRPMGSREKTFLLLGRKHGHQHDYDHVGMLVSKAAAGEVWPAVLQWLNARQGKGGA